MDDFMRAWTMQPETLYQKLKLEQVIRCAPEESELVTEFGFGRAYDWMAEQMRNRVGPPPEGVRYPIWAWHTIAGQHATPDLRRSEFRGYASPQVCLELELPDGDVLLSNEDMWHIVLNDGYCSAACNDADYETEDKWFDSLPAHEQETFMRQSWERIFEVSPPLEHSRGQLW